MKIQLQPLTTKFSKILQNKNNYIYIVLVVAFLLRFGAFLLFQPWEERVVSNFLFRSDGASYQKMALSFLQGIDNGETFWAPGFPAFLGLIYSIFGVKPWVVLLLNCFISTFSVFILYKIGEKLFSWKVALISALLMAIEPHQVIYTQTLYTENLFIPLILLFFLFALRYILEQKLLSIVIASVFLGLAMYLRPSANYLFIPAIISIFVFVKIPLKEKVKGSLIFLLGLLITLSPWLLRNYKLHDHFGLTTNGGFNLLYVFVGSIYNNQYQMHPDSTLKMLQDKVKQKAGGEIVNPIILDKTEKSVAVDLILHEPLKFIQNYSSGCINIYTSISSYHLSAVLGLSGNSLLGANFYGVSQFSQIKYFLQERDTAATIAGGSVMLFLMFSYLLVIAGIWRIFKDGKIKEMVWILGMILYFTLIVGTLGSSARFKLPIAPFYLVLSAYGINFLYKKWKQRKQVSAEVKI